MDEKTESFYMDNSFSGDRDEEMSNYFSSSSDKKHMKICVNKIRRLAKAMLLLAVAAITLSAFIISCKACGSQQTAGSGIWCSVYFLLISAMCLGKEGMLSSRITYIFGLVGIHFALLMLIVESIDTMAAFGEYPANHFAAVVHITLCVIAFVQLTLVAGLMFLHARKPSSMKEPDNSDRATSSDDCILTRTLGKQ